MNFDTGSFRDFEGSVFLYDEQVYRTLNLSASKRMKSLIEAPFFSNAIDQGALIQTKLLDSTTIFPKNLPVTPTVLWHEKIHNISYPFEWTFSMLKDASLLTLDLMQRLIQNGFILKDGTAWNVCFVEGNPCFYDILSIDFYQEGQLWNGLSQFLQEFLYPLMFQSYGAIDFQTLWRSTLQGVPAKVLIKTLSKKSLFKKGVFKYVYLYEKLSSSKSISKSTLGKDFSSQDFSKEALVSLLKNLRSCIESLKVKKDNSVWKEYTSTNSYGDFDVEKKEIFIREGIKFLQPSSVIDLGCNTGHYSLIASEFSQVISCDLDPTCLDLLYLQKNKKILPVVLNLMNPSPSMGWNLQERKDIFSRIKRDSFLALALIHHLCISQNIPLSNFVQFLKFIATRGIIEWVEKTDPMVQFLLRNRKDIFDDYSWENFKTELEKEFKIRIVKNLNGNHRKLILLGEK